MPESSVSIAEIIAVVVISKKVSQHFAIECERQNTSFHKKIFCKISILQVFPKKERLCYSAYFLTGEAHKIFYNKSYNNKHYKTNM